MRKALTMCAAGATLMVGVVSATGARAARSVGAAPRVVAGACTPGTWVQTPADVTAAMVNGNLLADTIVSSTDAWAVGLYDAGATRGSLWEHWTGGSSWSVVSSGGLGVELSAVTNFGPTSVWAAGDIQKGSKDSALISMWNGAKIVRATLPKKGKTSALLSISGSSASDIWASGVWTDAKNGQHILLYHYDGSTWSLATAPTGAFYPQGIIDLSPTSVYMVASLPSDKSDVYHYNGATWSVDLPDVPIDFDLPGFVGSSGSDLYGLDSTDYNGVDHWNGATWSHVGTFNFDDELDGLAEGPVGTVWSDGWFAGAATNEVYVGENGVRQTNPSAVMTQTGVMSGVASGSGLVIAVGGQDEDGSIPNSEPIVVMSCN
jgi:hypothetical protein